MWTAPEPHQRAAHARGKSRIQTHSRSNCDLGLAAEPARPVFGFDRTQEKLVANLRRSPRQIEQGEKLVTRHASIAFPAQLQAIPKSVRLLTAAAGCLGRNAG